MWNGTAFAPCGQCAGMFNAQLGSRGRPRTYCSPRCQQAANKRKEKGRRKPAVPRVGLCQQCAAEFRTLSARRRFCTTRCRDVVRGLVRAEPLPARTCRLVECAVTFVPKSERQFCCCEKHGKKHHRIQAEAEGRVKRPAWGDGRKDSYHRRRARKAAVRVGDPVRFSEIAARDSWTCYLCKAEVSPALAYPDPASPSLDHVVPLAAGGAHSPGNVRLTHLRCNLSKGARPVDGPVRVPPPIVRLARVRRPLEPTVPPGLKPSLKRIFEEALALQAGANRAA